MQREDIIIYNAEDGKTSVSLMAKDGLFECIRYGGTGI